MSRTAIENAVAAAVIALVTMAVLSRQLSADDAEYWKAKVTAANVVTVEANPWFPPVPQPPSEAPNVNDTKLPIVDCYGASWCKWCPESKAKLLAAAKAGELPFEPNFIDVSNGPLPAWTDKLPAYGWQHKGQTRYVIGFPGVKQLVEQWKATNKGQPQARFPPARSYNPRWTYPGEIRSHLQSSHGIPNASGLTQDQAERAHDAIHDALEKGYSQQQILNYARRNGLLK